VYLTSLPQELHFQFVIKPVAFALKTDEADARPVSNFFVQAASNGQCTPCFRKRLYAHDWSSGQICHQIFEGVLLYGYDAQMRMSLSSSPSLRIATNLSRTCLFVRFSEMWTHESVALFLDRFPYFRIKPLRIFLHDCFFQCTTSATVMSSYKLRKH